jgi:hypothetical protein
VQLSVILQKKRPRNCVASQMPNGKAPKSMTKNIGKNRRNGLA